MPFPQLRHFDSGTAMIVTDLHGEGDAFDHIMDTFFKYMDEGKADRLIICGDLIHIRRPVPDHSVRMMLDVIKWQEKLGEDKILMLMGNHEMPHVYNVTLSKGNEEYTAPFEKAVSESGEREKITKFMRGLPMFATTDAGVLICHAGASAAVTKTHEAQDILTFDHDALLRLADDRLLNGYDLEGLKEDKTYLRQAIYYLAITGADDPRYHHLLRGQLLSQLEEEFSFLWDVLFTRNEQHWGKDAYPLIAENFLGALSDASTRKLTVLVSGHISTRGGYEKICDQHLRLSTFAHANPHEAGKYLLLDCETPINSADELLPYLRSVYP